MRRKNTLLLFTTAILFLALLLIPSSRAERKGPAERGALDL